MIFITGDTHSDFRRFSAECFPEQKEMTRDDYVIICGDFGGVWNWQGESKEEAYWLNWLENKPFTTLFVDGNHECFPRLYSYPVIEWHGGCVHQVREHILHLMRGEIFEINGCSFFAFGGARSHDIQGGILEPDDPNLKEKCKKLDKEWVSYRINHRSWWEEEMPNQAEKGKGLSHLEEHGNQVDFIITHDCPTSTLALFGHGFYKIDELNRYLEEIRATVEFKKWFFGHYHDNRNINMQELMLYEQIIQIQ